MSTENNENTNTLQLVINGKEFKWHAQYITGEEIKKLANIATDDDVFLKIKDPWTDEAVLDTSNVDLARPGLEHFYSKEKKPQVAFIVNGREKQWTEKLISFDQVVLLAFGPNSGNLNTAFTVSYSRGPEKNTNGSMVIGDTVYVKNKMVFNVTATDKS
jgi:hypothetical protein